MLDQLWQLPNKNVTCVVKGLLTTYVCSHVHVRAVDGSHHRYRGGGTSGKRVEGNHSEALNMNKTQ